MNLTSPIPEHLKDAEERLERYGRWAADRPQIKTCGSAEGRYKIPQDDLDRQPKTSSSIDEMMQCQRALAAVRKEERQVLAILYIPRKVPIEAQIRMFRLDKRMFPERHISGLKQFDILLKTVV